MPQIPCVQQSQRWTSTLVNNDYPQEGKDRLGGAGLNLHCSRRSPRVPCRLRQGNGSYTDEAAGVDGHLPTPPGRPGRSPFSTWTWNSSYLGPPLHHPALSWATALLTCPLSLATLVKHCHLAKSGALGAPSFRWIGSCPRAASFSAATTVPFMQ